MYFPSDTFEALIDVMVLLCEDPERLRVRYVVTSSVKAWMGGT